MDRLPGPADHSVRRYGWDSQPGPSLCRAPICSNATRRPAARTSQRRGVVGSTGLADLGFVVGTTRAALPHGRLSGRPTRPPQPRRSFSRKTGTGPWSWCSGRAGRPPPVSRVARADRADRCAEASRSAPWPAGNALPVPDRRPDVRRPTARRTMFGVPWVGLVRAGIMQSRNHSSQERFDPQPHVAHDQPVES